MDTSRRKSRMSTIAASAHLVEADGQLSCNSSQRGRHCQPRPIFHRHFCFQLFIVAVVVIDLFHLVVANPVFVNNPSVTQFQSGRNIRHLPCVVRKSGLSGVCMFAIDCIKANGTHLGTCIDRFYFGSCCQVHDESVLLEPEINDNSIDQNTISHFQHESTTLPESGLFRITTPVTTIPTPVTSSSVQDIISSSIQNLTTAIRDANGTIVPIYSKPRPGAETSTELSNAHSSSSTVSTVSTSTTTSIPVEQTATTEISTVSEMVTTTMSVVTTTALPEKKPIKTTTIPTKVTTFQVVHDELTTIVPTTIATSTAEETTLPPFIPPPKRPTRKPSSNRTTTHKPTTSAQRPTTLPVNSIHTEITKKPVRTTTHKPHVTTTKRTPGKRPGTKRPSSSSTNKKPTKRPSTSHTSSSSYGNKRNSTKTPTKRPVKITTTTKLPVTTTILPTVTTLAPRPKPTPTAEIVKVPPTIVTEESVHKESNENDLPTTDLPTTTTAKVTPTKPAPTTTTVAPSSSTTTTPSITTTTPSITTTTPSITTTTTTVSPTEKPIAETALPPSSTSEAPTKITQPPSSTAETTVMQDVSTSGPEEVSPTQSSPSSVETLTSVAPTTNKPTPLTTSTTEASTPAITTTVPTLEEMTTLKPGLVTWTNVDETPTADNYTDDDNWSPPPAADWVPLVTISPFINSSIDEASISVTADEISTDSAETVQSTQVSTSTIPETIDSTTIGVQTSGPGADSSTSTTVSGVDLTMEGVVVSDFVTPDGGLNETAASANVSSSTAPSVSFEGIDYKQICGKRMFPEPRIVGGSNAAFGRWPWQISLRQWRTSTYLHKCGAALLNENWAITAAHCVDNVPPSDLLLRLGEYDLAEEEEPYGYQERRVQIVASHPQFDPRTFEYDLALLRFYEPVTFQPNIIPVCVPEDDTDFIGQTAFVTGWGRLYEDGPLPSVLQEVSVPIINNTICESMYRNAGYIEHIPHIFICAGWKKGGYDSCEGDSGGPMVLQRDDKRFLLGGVISWGIGCAEPNQPGVYTRISEFRDWINQILQF